MMSGGGFFFFFFLWGVGFDEVGMVGLAGWLILFADIVIPGSRPIRMRAW